MGRRPGPSGDDEDTAFGSSRGSSTGSGSAPDSGDDSDPLVPTSWKRDFASGLVIVMPLLVTAYIIWWLYDKLGGIPFGGIEQKSYRVVLVIVLFVTLVFAIGYLMRTAFGDVVEGGIDSLMNRLPGLRVVYNASKMAVETAVSGTEELQTPVKIETWDGLRMTAFKTGKSTDDGRDLLFLPTAPNITTGFVVEVEPENYEETDERVEDALTRILSAGFGETREPDIPLDLVEGGSESADRDDDATARQRR